MTENAQVYMWDECFFTRIKKGYVVKNKKEETWQQKEQKRF